MNIKEKIENYEKLGYEFKEAEDNYEEIKNIADINGMEFSKV